MKKFLLSLLIVPLLLIGGFSNAQFSENLDYNFQFSDLPTSFNSPIPLMDYEITINTRPSDMCYIWFNSSTCDCVMYFVPNGTIGKQNGCKSSCSAGVYSIKETNGWDCGPLNFSLKGVKQIVSVDNISPVITGISDVTTEFIPYVVYIGIGTLLVTLGFIVVKWLVNWLVRKITVIFKSKRG